MHAGLDQSMSGPAPQKLHLAMACPKGDGQPRKKKRVFTDKVCCAQDLVDPSQYLTLFPKAFAPLKSSFDLTSLSTLYNAVDFIGISAYPSLAPNFTTKDIESATQQYDLEISQFGINIKDLIFNKVCACWRPAMLHAWNHHEQIWLDKP